MRKKRRIFSSTSRGMPIHLRFIRDMGGGGDGERLEGGDGGDGEDGDLGGGRTEKSEEYGRGLGVFCFCFCFFVLGREVCLSVYFFFGFLARHWEAGTGEMYILVVVGVSRWAWSEKGLYIVCDSCAEGWRVYVWSEHCVPPKPFTGRPRVCTSLHLRTAHTKCGCN